LLESGWQEKEKFQEEFLNTYSLPAISSHGLPQGVLQGPELLYRLSFMIVCIISALYTGYFHYIMKMYN